MVIFGGESYSGVYLDDAWVLDAANGNGAAPVTKIAVSGIDRFCATKTQKLGVDCLEASGKATGCLVKWKCSEPGLIDETTGVLVSTHETKITVTACLLDDSLCSDPFAIEISPPPDATSSSSGGSSSGGSSACGGCTTNDDCKGVAERHNVPGAGCGTDNLCHACFVEFGSGTGSQRCITCAEGCGPNHVCMNGICAYPEEGAKTCE